MSSESNPNFENAAIAAKVETKQPATAARSKYSGVQRPGSPPNSGGELNVTVGANTSLRRMPPLPFTQLPLTAYLWLPGMSASFDFQGTGTCLDDPVMHVTPECVRGHSRFRQAGAWYAIGTVQDECGHRHPDHAEKRALPYRFLGTIRSGAALRSGDRSRVRRDGSCAARSHASTFLYHPTIRRGADRRAGSNRPRRNAENRSASREPATHGNDRTRNRGVADDRADIGRTQH